MSTTDVELRAAIVDVLDALRGLTEFKRYSDVVPRAGKPASERELRTLETRLGLALPPSYRRFLTWHNGYEWLAYPGHVLSVRDLSPGGEYWDDIRQWKVETAEAGYGDPLDGLVFAYMDQPNNWAYFDPGRIAADGEWAVVLHSPGADPAVFQDLAAFLHSCAANARLARQWTLERMGRDSGGAA